MHPFYERDGRRAVGHDLARHQERGLEVGCAYGLGRCEVGKMQPTLVGAFSYNRKLRSCQYGLTIRNLSFPTLQGH